MKQEFKPMSWLVKNFDFNAQVIKDYDVLRCYEDNIKKLKKKCTTKEEFAEALKREIMYQYWSRAEYELIISIDENGYVWLSPWVGCRNPENARIDVTNDGTFDWKGFAELHICRQIYKNEAKVDIYDQLQWVWSDFVTYCWDYHHKWQRRKKDDC